MRQTQISSNQLVKNAGQFLAQLLAFRTLIVLFAYFLTSKFRFGPIPELLIYSQAIIYQIPELLEWSFLLFSQRFGLCSAVDCSCIFKKSTKHCCFKVEITASKSESERNNFKNPGIQRKRLQLRLQPRALILNSQTSSGLNNQFNINKLGIMEPERELSYYESLRLPKDHAIVNQPTKCATAIFTSSTIQYELESCSSPSMDLSFQVSIHRENVEALKEVASKYLQQCLLGGYSESLGFKDAELYLYKQRVNEQKQSSTLDSLVTQNELLREDMKKQLFLVLREEQSLAIFLREMPEKFGLTVSKELTFVIYQILKEKYQLYNQLKVRPSIFPRFNAIQLIDDDYRDLGIQNPIFDQVNLEEVATFAEHNIEIIAKTLYFTNTEIKILNLKEITAETNPKANLVAEFTTLLKQISRSVFLTLAGGTQPSNSHGSLFDIPRDMSFTDFPELGMTVNKSLTRVPAELNEEQRGDLGIKKRKLQ